MPLFGEPGQRIGYRVYPQAEDGPPLLLIHGFTASPASFGPNVAELNQIFTVVTVELLGHGQSDAPASAAPYAPEPAVDRVLGLMDELGYERVLLCGHSLGGALAVRVALAAPERVAGLIVINSNSAAGTPEWRREVQPQLEEMAARLRVEGTGFLKRTRLYPARSQRLPAEWRAQLTADFDRLAAAGVAGTAEALAARVNAFERLSELTMPTLVVVGDRDPEFVQNAPRLVARLRRSIVQMVTIEGAGHAANLEQPQLFDEAVLRFAEGIGYLDRPRRPGGLRRTLLVVAGGLVAVAVAAVVLAVLVVGGGGDDSRAIVGANRTATPVANVAGARVTPTPQPSTSATAPGSTTVAAAATAPTTTTATTAPATATTAPATTPTATPARATPTPTTAGTATATASPTATATATPAGPAAVITGPSSCGTGCFAFGVNIVGRSPDYTVIQWEGPAGPKKGPSYTVQSAADCLTVSVTVVFSDATLSAGRTYCP